MNAADLSDIAVPVLFLRGRYILKAAEYPDECGENRIDGRNKKTCFVAVLYLQQNRLYKYYYQLNFPAVPS